MSSDEKDVQEREVDRYFPRDREANKPHKILIGNNVFSSFDDETMEDVEEGAVVSFDFETNGEFNNITKGSLVVHDDVEQDDSGDDAAAVPESPDAARIRQQVALKSAVEHHKHRDAAPEDVTATADTFNEWLKAKRGEQ